MDLASALLKQIIAKQDIPTWSALRKNYLPKELHALHDRIASFLDRFNKLPSFEELKFDLKNKQALQQATLIELLNVEAEPDVLLELLKTEYTQLVAFEQIESYIERSIVFESPMDAVEGIQEIVAYIEKAVDLDGYNQENMQRIELFDDEVALNKRVTLGLNEEFDRNVKFNQDALIMIGGRRGSGKSLTGANAVLNCYNNNKPSLYFSIEMNTRETLQRIAAAGAGVSARRLQDNILTADELIKLAEWWANRYVGGEEVFKNYSLQKSFKEFHRELQELDLKDNKFEILFYPELTLATLRSEIERKIHSLQPHLVVVDYVNKVKVSNFSKKGQYDWTEQMIVASGLKTLAQKYNVPIIAPYQIDASGEARMAKGILDPADVAFTLDAHKKKDGCITFNCTKMRKGDDEVSFTSKIDWETLKIGPENGILPTKETDGEDREEVGDTPW